MARKKAKSVKRSPSPKLDPEQARALADEGWENVGGDLSAESLNDGDTVVGVFRGLEDTNFKRDDGEPARVVKVETEAGLVSYWAPTVLQSRLETVNVGDEVRIECLGKARTGSGRKAWMFDVRVKRHSKPKQAKRSGAKRHK